jgi:hypothetical protein
MWIGPSWEGREGRRDLMESGLGEVTGLKRGGD